MATPTASLLLCSPSTLYTVVHKHIYISEIRLVLKNKLHNYPQAECWWTAAWLLAREFVFLSAVLAGDQWLFENPILADRMVLGYTKYYGWEHKYNIPP